MRGKKCLLSTVLTTVLLFGSVMTAGAANVAEVPATEVDSVYNQSVQSNAIEGWPTGPQIYSESGIVMDMDTGAVLYAKNIDDQHYPASITKILTALVALENTNLTDTVKFTWDDIGFLEYGDAHIGMKEDEEISMEDALYGMLLASANEVSHAIASNTPGGYEHFIEMMNEKVKELGGKNSHFMNANGLHDPEHYTSAYDMALISSAAFKYDKFREITNTYQHTIPATNISDETRTFQQNHKMIREWDNRYYEYCVGGKTGFTDQALTTLVTFATKDNMNLVAVVLRTHGGGINAYNDTRAIMNYAFDNFQKCPVALEQIQNDKIASVRADSYVTLPVGITMEQLNGSFISPTDDGDKTGEIVYTYQNEEVGKVEVTITEEYYNSIHGIEEPKEAEEPKEEKEKEKTGFPAVLKIVLVIVVLIVGVIVCLEIRAEQKRRKIRRKRSMMRKKRYENNQKIPGNKRNP